MQYIRTVTAKKALFSFDFKRYRGYICPAMTYLTVPIAAGDVRQAKKQIDAAVKARAEMLELRLDYIDKLTHEKAVKLIEYVKKTSLPVIATCRDKLEGGCGNYPVELRTNVLTTALDAGADFIDFEYQNFLSKSLSSRIEKALNRNPKSRLILSSHHFSGPFDNIKRDYNFIRTLYPKAIPKLVYLAEHINDCFDAFDLLCETTGDRIVLCMGRAGLISRIIAKKLGSFVTFASLDSETSTASGQLAIEQFNDLYRYNSIDTDMKLFGIIGSPVEHSASPAIHNAGFAKADLNKLYLPLLVDGQKEQFNKFMDNVTSRNWLNFKGFSVTIPHKINAINYVLEKGGKVDRLTKKIGAANTITIDDDGHLTAYNSDCSGAMKAITDKIENLNDKKTAVMGAGGVARAVVAGLTDTDAIVTIYNRTLLKAEKLADEFKCKAAGLDKIPQIDADIIINCTSIGMSPKIDKSPITKELIKKNMVVFDTVYNPRQTLLLKNAKSAGAMTIEGLDMFIAQAETQFDLFTGQKADTSLMRKTAEANL